jgi:hypothetical protein
MNTYCNSLIYDCGENQISTNDGCVKLSNNNCNTKFNILGSNYSNSVIDNSNIVKFMDVDLVGCLMKCNSSGGCSMVEFARYADQFSSDTGSCYIYNSGNIKYNPEHKSQLNLSTFYSRENISGGNSNCFTYENNPYDDYNKDVLVINSDGSSKPSQTPRIMSNYMGSTCRKDAAEQEFDPTEDAELLTNMGIWCNENPDVDVCASFCNNLNYNKFCAKPVPYALFASIGIFLLTLFIFSYFYIKRFNKPVLITFIIIFILSSIFMGYEIYKYFLVKDFSGTKKDYPASKEDSINKPKINGNWVPPGKKIESKDDNGLFLYHNKGDDTYRICEDKVDNCIFNENNTGKMIWDTASKSFIDITKKDSSGYNKTYKIKNNEDGTINFKDVSGVGYSVYENYSSSFLNNFKSCCSSADGTYSYVDCDGDTINKQATFPLLFKSCPGDTGNFYFADDYNINNICCLSNNIPSFGLPDYKKYKKTCNATYTFNDPQNTFLPLSSSEHEYMCGGINPVLDSMINEN